MKYEIQELKWNKSFEYHKVIEVVNEFVMAEEYIDTHWEKSHWDINDKIDYEISVYCVDTMQTISSCWVSERYKYYNEQNEVKDEATDTLYNLKAENLNLKAENLRLKGKLYEFIEIHAKTIPTEYKEEYLALMKKLIDKKS